MFSDVLLALIQLVDTIVVNFWNQAPQGGRVITLFLFLFSVWLAGDSHGERRERRRRREFERKLERKARKEGKV